MLVVVLSLSVVRHHESLVQPVQHDQHQLQLLAAGRLHLHPHEVESNGRGQSDTVVRQVVMNEPVQPISDSLSVACVL